MASLILLPNVLYSEETNLSHLFPPKVFEWVPILDGLIAEHEKEARRYLKRFTFAEGRSFRDVQIRVLNEHTKEAELPELLEPVVQGETWGIISDAGLPCLADPGARLVNLARQRGLDVEALSGPSSIILSLMLSGLSAQSFSFHGYLSREPQKRLKEIKALEEISKRDGHTQLFIEAPYRNQGLLDQLIENLHPITHLSVCCHLTAPDSIVKTLRVKEWRKIQRPDLHKKPTVFLLSAKD